MANRVRITEVGPRDGLQNEPGVIPTLDKVRLVELCASSGVDEVEVTSFVSPKWVPQLADSREVWNGVATFVERAVWARPSSAAIRPLYPKSSRGSPVAGHPQATPQTPPPPAGRGLLRPVFSVLVPNEKGLDGTLEVNRVVGTQIIDKVALFTAASETFSKRNTNASIDETMVRFRPVIDRAHAEGLLVRGYISCVIACPFEGPIEPDAVARVAELLQAANVDEIDIGDTIGAGTPETITALLKHLEQRVGSEWWTPDRFTLHLHDTFGRAAVCVKAALDLGVRSFDSSVAGLGGCPYASTPEKRAPGNISTETLVRTVHGAGFTTGVDMDALAAASAYASLIVAKSHQGA